MVTSPPSAAGSFIWPWLLLLLSSVFWQRASDIFFTPVHLCFYAIVRLPSLGFLFAFFCWIAALREESWAELIKFLGFLFFCGEPNGLTERNRVKLRTEKPGKKRKRKNWLEALIPHQLKVLLEFFGFCFFGAFFLSLQLTTKLTQQNPKRKS